MTREGGVATGSIVNISITRDTEKESRQQEEFLALQEEIFREFNHPPELPVIHQKAATQTSVTVAWEPLKLYNCEMRNIEVYKKGQRTNPHFIGHTAAKLTGLGESRLNRDRLPVLFAELSLNLVISDVNNEYEVHIIVRTSGGVLISNRIDCRTHAMDNLTGIRCSFGDFADPSEIPALKEIVERIGASWSEELTPETTHLICTLPRGDGYQRAGAMNIPVVQPQWLKQCEALKIMQPVGPYAVLSAPIDKPAA